MLNHGPPNVGHLGQVDLAVADKFVLEQLVLIIQLRRRHTPVQACSGSTPAPACAQAIIACNSLRLPTSNRRGGASRPTSLNVNV